MQVQFRHAEAVNAERFHLLHEALESLMQKKTNTKSPRGALNSGKHAFQ
ncbi:hypothetical protein A2U01_0075577, partial [Trifolium medium]|nr:hypothetical protein [Trifolium medium]